MQSRNDKRLKPHWYRQPRSMLMASTQHDNTEGASLESAADSRPNSSDRATMLGVSTALVALTCLIFARVVIEDFQFLYYDDDYYIFQTPQVTAGVTWLGIDWAFRKSAPIVFNWHPLTMISHMVDCEIYGLRSWGHHLTNVMWHAASVLILFLAWRKMTGAVWRSALVAALFAWHPLHVESVAWIAERKDLLCAFFWFLGIWFYASYVRRPGILAYVAVCGCLALGLFSKPMIVTFPCVLLLLDYWPLERYAAVDGTWRQGVRRFGLLLAEKAPLFILVALACSVTLRAQERAFYSLDVLPPGKRAINSVISYDTYLLKTIWPVDLIVHRVLDREGLTLGKGAIAAIPLVIASMLAFLARRRWSYLFVGWFWYLGTLVPVIGLVQVGEQAYADRYTYIPLVGLFVALAWGLGDLVHAWPRLKWPAVAGGATVLSLLAVLTVIQLGYWRDTATLMSHSLAINGKNTSARYAMARFLFAEGRLDDALNECNTILRDWPGYYAAHALRGSIYEKSNRPVDAAKDYAEALLRSEGKLYVHVSTAYAVKVAQMFATHPDDRNRDAKKALEFADFACKLTRYRDPVALDALAAAYAEAGRFEEAEARAQMALELAVRSDRPDLPAKIQHRIELYRSRKPFRNDPANSQF